MIAGNGRGRGEVRAPRFRVALAGLLIVCGTSAAACGAREATRDFAPTPTPTGGGSGTIGDAGASGVAPTIDIVAPGQDALLSPAVAPQIRAKISLAVGLLDPGSLTFTLTDTQATTTTKAAAPLTSGPLSGPTAAGEYTGRLDLADVPSGTYTLAVAASNTTGVASTKSVTVRVDTGPRIRVISPVADSAHKGTLVISVVVDSSPFEPTAPLEVTVAGRTIALPPIATISNGYQGSVDLGNYNPALVGAQLLSVAARNANGTRTATTVQFVVDETGPTIEPESPLASDVVGRIIDLRAYIHDPAGVVDSSVLALIGDQTTPQFRINLQSRGGGVYGAAFDTAQLTRCGLTAGGLPPAGTFCNVYPTISFRASDSLGNESALAYSFGIDNQPPRVDLDPPAIRIARRKESLQCSWQFDPLGDSLIPGNMPDDGCAVGQAFQLRARAEDDVNGARYLQVAPLATIDPEKIAIYLLNDTAQPLTVDSDGDGICDRINPQLVPTTNPPGAAREVLEIRLAAVPPQGAANFTRDPSLVGDSRCLPGDEPFLPKLLCRAEEPTIAISYGPGLAAVWSLEPIEPGGLRCFGNQFDAFANHIGGSRSRASGTAAPGWACIAVEATDKVGNTGVSAPLRVWIDYDGAQVCPAAAGGATSPPPNCTGHLDAKTGTISNVPCQSRRFDRPAEGPELCLDGRCG
jgi:hypothetical protein